MNPHLTSVHQVSGRSNYASDQPLDHPQNKNLGKSVKLANGIAATITHNRPQSNTPAPPTHKAASSGKRTVSTSGQLLPIAPQKILSYLATTNTGAAVRQSARNILRSGNVKHHYHYTSQGDVMRRYTPLRSIINALENGGDDALIAFLAQAKDFEGGGGGGQQGSRGEREGREQDERQGQESFLDYLKNGILKDSEAKNKLLRELREEAAEIELRHSQEILGNFNTEQVARTTEKPVEFLDLYNYVAHELVSHAQKMIHLLEQYKDKPEQIPETIGKLKEAQGENLRADIPSFALDPYETKTRISLDIKRVEAANNALSVMHSLSTGFDMLKRFVQHMKGIVRASKKHHH